jgi:hypothetical protein
VAAGAKRDAQVDQASEASCEDGMSRETIAAIRSRSGSQAAKGNGWVDNTFDSQSHYASPSPSLIGSPLFHSPPGCEPCGPIRFLIDGPFSLISF